MNEEFLKSIDNIREESFAMLKSIRAVRGESYSRLVHSIILADQIETACEVFREAADDRSKDIADHLAKAQMNMVGQIMKYFVRSTGYTDEQIAEAFADAKRIQGSTYELIDKAHSMSQSGQVMGE